MKSRLVPSVFVLFALAAAPAQTAEPDTFGQKPSLSQITPLAEVLAKPAAFEGQTLRVEGVVTAVCEHMGCWMALAPNDAPGAPTVLIKVDDGVIVFPISAKGRRASAQGVFQRVGGGGAEGASHNEEREAASEHARNEGREPQASADSWLLKTTGAVVY